MVHAMVATSLLPRDEVELLEDRDAIVEAELLGDHAVDDLDHGGTGELHPPARVRRQRADGEVVERWAGVCAAALPLPDDVVALGDEVGGRAEAEIGERLAERQRELAHLVAAAEGLVQRVLEADVGRGELVDDARVEVAAPEVGEPANDDGLVVLDRHAWTFLVGIGSAASPAGAGRSLMGSTPRPAGFVRPAAWRRPRTGHGCPKATSVAWMRFFSVVR